MSVTSVTGVLKKDELGIISPHDHVLVDLRNQFVEVNEVSKKALSEQKVGIDNLGVLSRNPYAIKDNLVLNDVSIAKEELMEFKKAGGNTIVDATCRGIGRNPKALKDISKSTGIFLKKYHFQNTYPIGS